MLKRLYKRKTSCYSNHMFLLRIFLSTSILRTCGEIYILFRVVNNKYNKDSLLSPYLPKFGVYFFLMRCLPLSNQEQKGNSFAEVGTWPQAESAQTNLTKIALIFHWCSLYISDSLSILFGARTSFPLLRMVHKPLGLTNSLSFTYFL